MKHPVIVNGIQLDNRASGWIVENQTQVSPNIGFTLAGVSLSQRDGIIPLGTPRFTSSEFGLVMVVSADNFAQRMERQAALHRLVMGHQGSGKIGLKIGATIRTTTYRVESINWEDLTPTTSRMKTSLELPYPIWVETEKQSGSLTAGQHEILELANANAPTQPVWKLPTGTTTFKARCLVSGEETLIRPLSTPLAKQATISGWNSDLGANLLSYGRIFPNITGKYRVTITTDATTIEWEGHKSWM